MSHRQFIVGMAGVALLTVGLLALGLPIYLNSYDQFGVQIGCGSGFSSNLTQAVAVDGADDEFVARCATALLIRRLWAFAAVIGGWLLITEFLFVWMHSGVESSRSVGPQ